MTRTVYDTPYLLDKNEKPLQSLIGYVEELETDIKMHAENVLTFKVPIDSVDIEVEQQVIFRDTRYTITEVEASRSGMFYDVLALSSSIELDGAYIEYFKWANKPFREALDKVLERTRWKVGEIESDQGRQSFLEDNVTVLKFLRKAADIVDMYVQFDTVHRLVNFYHYSGKELDVLFRYRRNLSEVKRKVFAPVATKIKPVGKDDVTIKEHNNGSPYIEDLSYYTEQGFSESEARRRFEKAHTWYDRRFLNSLHLLKEARKKLKILSRPQVAYSVEAQYLDQEAKDINVGDYGYVVDEELDIKVRVHVVRKQETLDVREAKLELNYLVPELSHRDGEGAGGGGNETAISHGYNKEDLTVKSEWQAVIQMNLTAFRSSNALVGLTLVGLTNSDTGLLESYIELGGKRVETTNIFQNLFKGWHTISGNFVIPSVPEGTNTLTVFVKSSAPIEFKRYKAQIYITGDGLLGGSGGGDGNIRAQEYLTFETVTDAFSDSVKIDKRKPRLIGIKEPTNLDAGDFLKDDWFVDERGVTREEFAKLENYPGMPAPSQEAIDEFIDVTYSNNKSFALLEVDGAIVLLTSSKPLVVDYRNGQVTSDANIMLLDLANEDTNIGKLYAPAGSYRRLEIYRKGWG